MLWILLIATKLLGAGVLRSIAWATSPYEPWPRILISWYRGPTSQSSKFNVRDFADRCSGKGVSGRMGWRGGGGCGGMWVSVSASVSVSVSVTFGLEVEMGKLQILQIFTLIIDRIVRS